MKALAGLILIPVLIVLTPIFLCCAVAYGVLDILDGVIHRRP
jgi:hypothetical protein